MELIWEAGMTHCRPEESNELYAKATRQKEEKPQPLRGVLHRFPRAILRLALVSKMGTDKRGIPLEDMSFADDPESYTRYGEAVVRHLLMERIEGPINSDPADQGFHHDEQAAWDALARLECRLRQEEEKNKYWDDLAELCQRQEQAEAWPAMYGGQKEEYR